MQANNPKRNSLFNIVVTPHNISLKVPRPKRSVQAFLALNLLLIVVIIIAVTEREMRSKVLELVMSIIEALLTFLSTSLKNK